MKRYNIIFLVDAAGEHVLTCRRVKPPYEGLLNLVGGKALPGEDGLHAAYRELREETGVTAADVALSAVMTFNYPGGGSGLPPYALEAWAGRLRHDVAVQGDENPLVWTRLTADFFDMTRFAGEGNIGHIREYIRRYRPELVEAVPMDVRLTPLSQEHLPAVAFGQGTTLEHLAPMLAESLAKCHEGRYYEQFAIHVNGCVAGLASLYEQAEGVVSDGIEVFPTFRRCGVAGRALTRLATLARERGCRAMTAQVRTDNAASIALHTRAGFAVTGTRVNRRGNEVHDMEKQLRPAVWHDMSLRPKPFAAIASGAKRYELRLHDEKRKLIRIGDRIVFRCTADERFVVTRVTSLTPFESFAELYRTLPLTQCGYTQENVHLASPRDMERYYPPEKQAMYGVLAIGVEVMEDAPVVQAASSMTMRPLTEADVPEMLRVAQGNPLYYQHMRMQPDPENIAATLTALPPRRTMADKHMIGWFDGGSLVALMDLIACHPEPDMAFIGWFMVDAARQGCGLGRKLVGGMLALMASNGVREVRLGRIAGNPQSEAFWRACGFEDTPLGYDTDDYHVTVMRKSLT